MSEVTIYELGVRDDGIYTPAYRTLDRSDAVSMAKMILKNPSVNREIVLHEKAYKLVSTTPTILNP